MSASQRSLRNPFAGLPLVRFGEQREQFDPSGFGGELRILNALPDGRIQTQSESPQLAWADPSEAADRVLLGHYQGILYAVQWRQPQPQGPLPPAQPPYPDLRMHAQLLDDFEAGLAAYARAMVIWHQRHRHCGLCGASTTSEAHGHRRRCSNADCATEHFPRVDPAIIVAVSCGERLLLARQASWPERRYSVLAGFVEPGESLEDCVVREVFEESGVVVRECDYHSSQPWPFPSGLMLGFTAQTDREDLTLDDELEHALWLDPEELVAAIAAGRLRPPSGFSISRRLVEDWYLERRGQSLSAAVAASRAAEPD
ncbi:MAG: NAD(+) diphosphatase [Xanthomonadales bacterium]|nr:NAD(+) diphosphatase [Xanthomonadales bacterium]